MEKKPCGRCGNPITSGHVALRDFGDPPANALCEVCYLFVRMASPPK
jgi:hypothetical protein